MIPGPKSQLTTAALVAVILIVVIQLYLFETVLAAVLDGQRGILPGALAVSAVLSLVALLIALKLPFLDRRP